VVVGFVVGCVVGFVVGCVVSCIVGFVEGVVCEGGFGTGATATGIGRFVDGGVGFVGRVVEG